MAVIFQRALLLAIVLLAQPALADGIELAKDPAYLTFSGGYFDINRQKDEGAEFSLEYRSDVELWIFKPFAHAAYVTNGMSFVGAGVLIDVQVGDNWIIQPSFAPTWWRGKTDDLDLGYALEFRSRLEVAYRFPDKSRLGLSFSHSSNASLGDTNPGTESLMVNVSIPTTLFGN
ncbi:MAG: acyloxyacyl hydrolase [Rhodospirillales bacterium]|nr:acyloxyacyl hydrolase [Rhodospirillales bacterium]MBO6788636.1 acyloxyacyl hydrolase [Rhodospirillales bacterium]